MYNIQHTKVYNENINSLQILTFWKNVTIYSIYIWHTYMIKDTITCRYRST